MREIPLPILFSVTSLFLEIVEAQSYFSVWCSTSLPAHFLWPMQIWNERSQNKCTDQHKIWKQNDICCHGTGSHNDICCCFTFPLRKNHPIQHTEPYSIISSQVILTAIVITSKATRWLSHVIWKPQPTDLIVTARPSVSPFSSSTPSWLRPSPHSRWQRDSLIVSQDTQLYLPNIH
jgi:hypothetical protein